MATSPYDDTTFVLDFIGRLFMGKEASFLDVGAGFGRWGFLLRCHLGCGCSLTVQKPQKVRIDAIEAFRGNISPIYDCVYDRTHTGDAKAILPGMGRYDVVICSHVIEHFEKDAGLRVLDDMVAHAKVCVILALPFGTWSQEAYGGNDFELHRSSWCESDFSRYKPFIKRFGSSGVVIIPTNKEARWQTRMMSSSLRRTAFRFRRWLRCGSATRKQ